jgi:hypothetical protein
VVFAGGCQTTRNVSLVENPEATSRPSEMNVVTKGGSDIVIYAPVVQRDSLHGFLDEQRTNPTVLAVSDIKTAKSRQFSGGRTAALVVTLVAATLLTLFGLALAAFSEGEF